MAGKVRAPRDNKLKDRAPLRRYLDLAKYIDLLRTSSLYFCRADRFSDKFEGVFTSGIRKKINEEHTQGSRIESADNIYQRSRMGTFVNCWTFGKTDNMALWQLYGGASNSVAINTTFQRLDDICRSWDKKIQIEKVRYIDHFENPNMIIETYTDSLKYKHKAYEFEREIRIMLPQQDNWESNPEGMLRKVLDLNSLVTSVVVAPEAGSWFYELVQDVTNRYGLKAEVRMSKLAALPE